jgi:hypothetical protein
MEILEIKNIFKGKKFGGWREKEESVNISIARNYTICGSEK